jgi:ABC-2 type transport system permease protein
MFMVFPPMLRIGMTDFLTGLSSYQLWSTLAWNDVQRTSQRTRLGVILRVIGFFIIGAGLGLLYARIFGRPPDLYVPYIAAGFMCWSFITAPLAGGGLNILISNKGLLTQIQLPITTCTMQFVCRQVYIFGLELIAYYLILLVFRIYPETKLVAFFFGFLLITCSIVAWATIAGLLGVFQRWMLEIMPPIIRMLFFITPIIWIPTMLTEGDAGNVAGKASLGSFIILLNPFYHYLEVLRGPLIGNESSPLSWSVVVVTTVVSLAFALILLGRTKKLALVEL